MLSNTEIADILNSLADALEEQDEDFYRVRAHRRAANTIRRTSYNIYELVLQDHDLTVLPNIGKNLAEKIKRIILTGEIKLPTAKTAVPYPDYLKLKKRRIPFFRIYSVTRLIEKILKKLTDLPEVEHAICASEYRRKKELISDVIIVVLTHNNSKTFASFQKFTSVKYIIETAKEYTTVALKMGIYITLMATDECNFYPKLLAATGSDDHYQKLQALARRKNMRLNSQGLHCSKNKLVNNSEEIIYQTLGLTYIEPELRENRGEIPAAAQKKLPKLLELSDIRGDLHCHTNETDGAYTLIEMVEAARLKGYKYLAITDHSQSLKITNGMNEKRLLKQIKQIDKLNEKLVNFRILKSMEVDILDNGVLDLSQNVLKELDLTVCSIHSKFRTPLAKQTERIIRAMDNPYFNILGHATGRLLRSRPPYELDMQQILQAAKERGCIIEVNAQPARLDINDIFCKQAKEYGVKVAISSDAHAVQDFEFMVLGVNQARRGWLSAQDVVNTYPLAQLLKIIKRH